MPDESPPILQYLSVDDILDVYIELFGGTRQQALDLLRDHDGFESGLGRLHHWAYYEHADIATQAAVLAHSIAEGQHFLEGNKRTALVAMRTFLLVNGFDVKASQQELFSWILGLSRDMSIVELATAIRRALVRI